MALDPKSKEGLALRQLFPLKTMPAPRYRTLCADLNVIEKPKDTLLFKQGDTPESFIYLIHGTVSLEANEFKLEIIEAETDSAKFAIAHQFPRQISARAMSDIRYVELQLNAFDKQEAQDIEEKSNYMVENEDLNQDTSQDWMSALLKSPIFQRLPPTNLQQVLISLQDTEIPKGQVIFNQGDSGDYYYLIKKGYCSLSRKATKRAKEIKLLELGPNDTFGEDALLSGEPRSMTITALTDMLLARIDKERFTKLIKEPALTYIDYPDLVAQCSEYRAIIIDIRSTDAYKKHHLEGSRSIPFFTLRMHLKALSDEEKKVIIICDDGNISKAAAFLLINRAIDAEILDGGIQNIPKIEPTQEASNPNEAVFAIDEGEEVENSDIINPEGLTISTEDLTAQELDLALEEIEADISLGQFQESPTEIESLKAEIEELKTKNQHLVIEAKDLKQKYTRLLTQTQKLKVAFDKLRGQSQ